MTKIITRVTIKKVIVMTMTHVVDYEDCDDDDDGEGYDECNEDDDDDDDDDADDDDDDDDNEDDDDDDDDDDNLATVENMAQPQIIFFSANKTRQTSILGTPNGSDTAKLIQEDKQYKTAHRTSFFDDVVSLKLLLCLLCPTTLNSMC